MDGEDGGLIPVNSSEEIPRFANEDEARAFWQRLVGLQCHLLL